MIATPVAALAYLALAGEILRRDGAHLKAAKG